MIEIWGVACKYLLNSANYKKMCLASNKMSSTGLYFSTNAEHAMQYLSEKYDFIEDHTALSDAEIETEILFYCLKRGKIVQGIIYFPYKMLGETVDFVMGSRGITEQMAANVARAMHDYLPDDEMENPNNYQKMVLKKLGALEAFMEENWG